MSSKKSRRGTRDRPFEIGVVCMHVIDHAEPILLVWRDREDEGFGLACGRGDHLAFEDWGTAHAFHYIARDRALGIVHILRPGEGAVRERPGSPWRRLRDSREPQHPPP